MTITVVSLTCVSIIVPTTVKSVEGVCAGVDGVCSGVLIGVLGGGGVGVRVNCGVLSGKLEITKVIVDLASVDSTIVELTVVFVTLLINVCPSVNVVLTLVIVGTYVCVYVVMFLLSNDIVVNVSVSVSVSEGITVFVDVTDM